MIEPLYILCIVTSRRLLAYVQQKLERNLNLRVETFLNPIVCRSINKSDGLFIFTVFEFSEIEVHMRKYEKSQNFHPGVIDYCISL